MHTFTNLAGHRNPDNLLVSELGEAGIGISKHEIFRSKPGEVKSSVIGNLHGWIFERAWSYWICQGPGIDVETAERLHKDHGKEVRVDGHCGCPSPRERFLGLACGHYHVDTPVGLKALADTIKGLVEK